MNKTETAKDLGKIWAVVMLATNDQYKASLQASSVRDALTRLCAADFGPVINSGIQKLADDFATSSVFTSRPKVKGERRNTNLESMLQQSEFLQSALEKLR